MARKKADESGSIQVNDHIERSIKFNKRKFKFSEKQRNFFETFYHYQTRIIFVSGPAGTAKAQPLDADIITPQGIVKMGELSVEDEVFSQNGKPTKILEIHPQGPKNIYKITFSDGTSTECCGEHLWLTQTDYDRNYRIKNSKIRFKSPRAGSVKTTDEIKESLFINGRINHSIPITCPVEFPTKELKIPPYVLGVLLGDGSLTTTPRFSSVDVEIVDKVSKILETYQINKIGPCDYSIINPTSQNNPLKDSLKEMGLMVKSAEKFIPEDYLYSDIQQRLELLRGLMDTDGTISQNKRGSCSHESFSSVSLDLVKGVLFLIQSLGGTGTISDPQKSYYYDHNGDKVYGQDYYTLHICFNPQLNPFFLPRKAKKYIPKTKYKPHRYITNIESLGEKECQCILVEDDSHLYLTNDFIVTHNTYMSLYAALEEMQKDWEREIIYVRSIAESADKGLGSLPGGITEKFDPFLIPLYDKIDEIVSPGDAVHLRDKEKILSVPINFLRGANWINKLVIADEAQNFTLKELTTLITRLGEGTKLIICGDPMQSDINGKSGFKKVMDVFNDAESQKKGIYCVTLTEEDIVRDPLLKFIVKKLSEAK